jgi:Lon protease-like protein
MTTPDDTADAAVTPLPASVPVFPLTGAILMPRGVLPLNIFEPRYLAVVRDAMTASGTGNRIIGMVQPRGEAKGGLPPPLFATGCLGRITEYQETPDGRILIALVGISRFRIAKELDRPTPYRQVLTDYHGFGHDRDEPAPLAPAVRAGLEDVLRDYLDAQGLAADWDAVKNADDDSLVTTLSCVCPFAPAEKQALLEATTLAARADTLAALMTFAGKGAASGSDRPTLQ